MRMSVQVSCCASCSKIYFVCGVKSCLLLAFFVIAFGLLAVVWTFHHSYVCVQG